MTKNQTVTYNEKEITLEQLQTEKAKLATQKGVKLVEVSPNVFKTRLLG